MNCYAVVTPGLEDVAAEELQVLGGEACEPCEGGVQFSATMDGLYRIHLRSRIVTRVLVRLASFTALSFPELYNKSRKPDWARYIAADASVTVEATCRGSKLIHSGRVEQAVADAVADKLGAAPGGTGVAQQIRVRIDNNRVTLSIDATGDRLDRRGYRLASGKAPLRETIAAGLLAWLGWREDEPLLSPMCGSGTFAIEAAWMAMQRASGLSRDFALVHWPCSKQKRWLRVLERAETMQRAADGARIFASDIDAEILEQAKRNTAAAGVDALVHFEQADVRALTPPAGLERPGLVICNPPYGDRIKGNRIKGNTAEIYRALGDLRQGAFRAWRMAVIVPDRQCEAALGVPVKRRLKFRHGGNWVQLLEL